MNKNIRKLVIWGVTPLAKYLIDHIVHKNKKYYPLAIVDNKLEVCNTYMNDIPIISCDTLEAMENKNEITVLIAVRNARNIFQILEQLECISVSNIGIAKPEIMYSHVDVDPWIQDDKIVWSIYGENKKSVIPYIEVNLIDACNLKCKGCTHFSSLYEEGSVYPIKEYKEDLMKMRKIGYIFRIRLLGGEPFLLNNLTEYITITRNIFPESAIEIVTNGLLITKMDGDTMMTIKDNNACIMISLYPPTYMIKKQIEEHLNFYGILYNYEMGDGDKEIVKFYRNLTLEDIHDAESSNRVCSSATCTFLRKGKLYKCPFDALINDFYHYYGLQKNHEGGIDLDHNGNTLLKKIKDYAYNPVKLCRYCSETPEMIPWSVEAKPLLCDWLYKEGK